MADWPNALAEYRTRVASFALEANALFAGQELSKTRLISLDATRRRLATLSLQQDELLQQALRCCEFGVFRAAHILTWSAFMDFLEQKLTADNLAKLHTIRPTWAKFRTLDELRENVPEHQLIEVARELGLYSKAEMKSLLGLLAKRNECAHPSGFEPGLNESVGYLSELLNRIEKLMAKHV